MANEVAVLSEHEAPASDPENNRPQQSPAEKKLIKKVMKLLHEAKAHRERYDKDWLSNYKFFRGLQWEQERPEYRHSEVINLVFQTIQSVIPILTDSRPRFEFLPEEPGDLELSIILNQVAESDWRKHNWLNQVTEVLYDSHIYGTGMAEMGYEQPHMDIGNITLESKDVFYCYPDPNATNVNIKSDYFIYAEPMDLRKIKKKWKKGKYVVSDIDDTEPDKEDVNKLKFKSPTDNVVAFDQEKVLKDTHRKRALVITCYLKDDSFDEEEKKRKVKKKNKDGEEVEVEEKSYVQRLKFPKGRKVVISNGILLEDRENPYDDGKFPYAKNVNYILPREFWGESELKQLKGPQMIFNKMVSFALDVLTLMGNPVWIVDTASGVDTDNIYNRPGEIIEKEPGSEVRREEGTQLQPYVLQLIDRMKVWFDELSGANDVTRGVKPAGVQAGIAITALQEAAQTRLRLKSRNLDDFLQDLGQMYISRVFQFYSAPRIIRLTNMDSANQYFRFSINQDEETGEKVATVQDISVMPDLDNEEAPAQVIESPERKFAVRGKFDVKVSTGSLLPFSKAEKESKLLNLYDRGIIDKEEVLKGIDFPNWEAILQRVQQQEQAAAQAEAQAQGQQA